MIKAPFNFVPLANKIYTPEWGKEIAQGISLDIPYRDGISGSLYIQIETKTPLFVRNGHGSSNTSEGETFCQMPDGRYFIPATTVKGCIRNVLEIMSFCKMKVDKNSAFAQREWNNPSLYTLKNVTEQSRMLCGWLVADSNGGYKIKKCPGHPHRINLRRIDEFFQISTMHDHFSAESAFDITKECEFNGAKYDPKTARFKYALMQEEGISKQDLKGLFFSEDDDYQTERSNRYVIDDNGSLKGTLVFTGQPDKTKNWISERDKNNGKFYEFIFEDGVDKEYPISEELFDNYNFMYSESEDWKEWKKELENDGIPVFFRLEQTRKETKVKDFGIAQLYKLPYEHTPYTIEERRHHKNDPFIPDMAECIFGYSSNKMSQKGRVQFSNFISNNAELDKNYILVLNSPKASYYPIYIRQDNGRNGITNVYQTYNDGNLAGWKRYVNRNRVWERKTGNKEIDSIIHPVKPNSVFHGRVTFHNLKPEELGALLSAITFHDSANCYHQMGQAKPYGFGRICVSIDKTKVFEDNSGHEINYDYALARFEYALLKEGLFIDKDQSIGQLITMASTIVNDSEDTHYMTLDVDNRINEFVDAKGGDKGNMPKEYLQTPSALLKSLLLPKSKLTDYKESFESQEKAEAKRLKEAKAEAEAKAIAVDAARKEAEEKARAEAKAEKYAISFSELVHNSKYLATDIDEWTKIDSNSLTDADIEMLITELKLRGKKEAMKIIKKSKFINKQDKSFAKRLIDSL